MLNEVIVLYKEKRYDEAIDLLTKHIFNNPEDNDSKYILAICYLYRKKYDKAEYYFNEAASSRVWKKKALEHIQKIKELNLNPKINEDTEKVIKFKVFKSDLTFNDIAGNEPQKKFLKEHVIDVIKHKKLFKEYNKRLSAGILFYGSPGNGKTMLARALAGETQSYMITVNIHEILGQYVGVSEKNIARLFYQASIQNPCIIFIDEIDALGSSRSKLSGGDEQGGTQSLKMVVNALLTQIDGIEKNSEGIFIVCATNRPWDIDNALLRPGRIEDMLYISPPDYKGRYECFKINLKNKKNVENINYDRLTRATEGFSYTDINKICGDVVNIQVHDKINGITIEPIINTFSILKVIKKYKSTLPLWFNEVQRELIGRQKTEVINGKKVISQSQGKLDKIEIIKYSDMIRYIKKLNSFKYTLYKKVAFFTACYLY